MSNSVTVDAKQVIQMFRDLDHREQKKVYKTALRKAAGILIKETRSNLRNIVKGKITNKKKDYKRTLSTGIRSSVDREGTQASVHIMGEYRLKWFEKGTNLRRTNKGYNRGAMKAHYFFRDAQRSTEKEVFSSIERLITDSIIRINNKHK